MLAAGSFALLCLANLVAIEYGESPPATLGPMVRANPTRLFRVSAPSPA